VLRPWELLRWLWYFPLLSTVHQSGWIASMLTRLCNRVYPMSCTLDTMPPLVQLSVSGSIFQASWITSSSASTNWMGHRFSAARSQSNLVDLVGRLVTCLSFIQMLFKMFFQPRGHLVFIRQKFTVLSPTNGHLCLKLPVHVIQSLVEFTRVLNAFVSLNLVFFLN
jgi:hypothetical protein